MTESFVDARKIFEMVKERQAQAEREQAEAERGRVEQSDHEESDDYPFSMDPKEGLTVKVTKGSGKNEHEEILWLAAPFIIVGRVRDPKSEGWALLLSWKDDDYREHEYAVSDSDLHGDVSVVCSTLATCGLKITTGPLLCRAQVSESTVESSSLRK